MKQNWRGWHRPAASRWLALVLVLVCSLAWVRPARAEVVRFDPDHDAVPSLLPADELARLETLLGAGYVYLVTDPSPDGRHVLAVQLRGDDVELGFLDLQSGAWTALAAEVEIPGEQAASYRWLDEDTLAMLTVKYEEDPQGGREAHYYQVTYEVRDGSTAVQELDFSWLEGFLVDLGPGWRDALIAEVRVLSPPAVSVDIGPRFEPPLPQVPEDVPGRVGERPLASVELQQVELQLALVRLDGSERRPLVSLPIDSGLAAVTWSPDGRRLLVGTRTMPGWQASRQDRSDPRWIPNLGSPNVQEALGLLAPTENPLVTGTRFRFFDTASGAEQLELANLDYPQGLLADVRFAPSGGKALVILASPSQLAGRPHPTYAYPSAVQYLFVDFGRRPLAPQALAVTSVPGADSLSAEAGFLDDDRLYFVVPDEWNSRVQLLDLRTAASQAVWEYPGALLQMIAVPGGLVFPYSNIDRPWEVWRWDAASGVARQLTHLFDGVAQTSRLRSTAVEWVASDGTPMRGLMVHHEDTFFPPSAPSPIVFWQQGGPGGQMWNDFGASVESPYSLLPHFGLPVLIANAAGRSIRSPEFYRALADGQNFGQVDIRQIKDGIDQLAAHGWVDAQRVGLTGCSYGGYFTLQSLRTYPTTYAAVNPQCSLVDLTNEFTFGYAPLISYLMGSSPFADVAEYLRDSPLYGLAGVRTPTLIFHGADDFLPVPLMHNVHDELEANGAPVRFLRFTGEGHGLRRASSQKLAAQEQILFFRRYLGVESFAPTPRSRIYLPAAQR